MLSDPLVACVLAGGLGTRLRPLTDTIPKPMVPVAGRPFLWHQLARLADAGVADFVLAVGYRHEQVTEYFGDGSQFGWRVRYAVETSPLGTGGAIAHALPMLGERFLALNGDTYLDLDFAALFGDPWEEEGYDGCLVGMHRDDCAAFGRLDVDGRRLVGFREKDASAGPGLVNAGVYLLTRRLLAGRTGAFSLERDVLPAARLAVLPLSGEFVDIGTFSTLSSFRARMEEALS
ncbi:MAG: nucleotidyltransferase family protein [Myxococcota bacterium]